MCPIFVAFLLISLNYGNTVMGVDVDDIKIEEYNDYVLLASDVQEYFKARSVFIIYAGNDESIRTTTLINHLTLKFSTKSVLSLNQNYTDVLEHPLDYRGRINRPLFVVFLSNPREMHMFQGVTSSYDMSYPSWLMIFTEKAGGLCSRPPGNYLNVTFDTEMLVKCYGDATIREWYSLTGRKLIIKDLAVWDAAKGLMLKTSKSLYERRNSLEGRVLHIATVRESPFVEGQAGPLGGLFGTILQELSKTLNFTINIKYKEDSYGIYDERSRSWSGAIGRLVSKEVDIGVSEFTMTRQRLDAVDFTLPIMLSRNHLYMRQPDYSALQWSAYFKVYTRDVWLVTGATLVISSIVVMVIRVMMRENKPPATNLVSETCLFVLGILCQQSVPEFPESSPTRIAYLSILLKAVVFQAVYSACLISYLTLNAPSLPFNDIVEFAQDGSYKLITFQQGAGYVMFATSEDWVLMKMMRQMERPEYLPKTTMAGFRQACERKVAFYATEAVKSQISGRIPCDLGYINTGRIDSLGLTLTRKSQYTGVINYHLQKFKDVGIMNHLKSQVYTKVLSSDNRYNSVGIRGVVTILLILFAGIAISLVVLVFEILMHHRAEAAAKRKRRSTMVVDRIVVTKNHHIKRSGS